MEAIKALFLAHPVIFSMVVSAVIFFPLFLIPAFRLRKQSGAEVGGATEKVA